MTALCEYLEHQVRWHAPNKNGDTDAELYGHVVQIPDDPELEPGSEHILQWFWELNAKRQPGFSGLSPITFSDVAAWKELTGKYTRPDEIDAILAMDSAYLSALNAKHKQEDT